MVFHKRHAQAQHSFTYSYPMFLLDLDEVEEIASESWLFGLGSRRFFSFLEGEYLFPGEESLKSRVLGFLEDQGISSEEVSNIELLTVPKFFGLGFNPVSFYFLRNKEGSLKWSLAEVNNTFRERHIYLLEPSESSGGGMAFVSSSEKVFHVSPFFDREGEYEFRIESRSDGLSIRIHYRKGEKPLLTATLDGAWIEFTSRSLRSQLIRHPWVRTLTMARIHYQAALLYFKKKLPVKPKPEPISPQTTAIPKMGFRDRFFKKLLTGYLKNLSRGSLVFVHSDGTRDCFGKSDEQPRAEVRVHNPRFYRRTVLGGDIGFGESYTDGDWSADDLTSLLRLLILNRDLMKEYSWGPFFLFGALGRTVNRFRTNTRKRSEKNVAAHYDLNNEFFQMFLDPSMTYSCGFFSHDGASLEEAQREKIDRILSKAEIPEEGKILEIGTGWGGLASRLAQKWDCPVTSITLSKEQLAYSRKLIEEAKLSERVRIDFKDYREISGVYDRIVSVEMLEAVGQRHLPVFFKKCQEILRPDGKVVLQVITLSDKYYEAYRKGRDWIQKHIFPGGFLPSVEALDRIIRDSTDFTITNLEDIGPHYATTIREWRKRFIANRDRILGLGFDETFCRKWLYYFAYCEAAFDTRTLGVQQIVLERRRMS
ncbi:MAG: DUF1365 family protein [Candidatus Omnitrophica bacterium]|nr:DUF1365 family protein [Candidatus Omnitrophota bacterium]